MPNEENETFTCPWCGAKHELEPETDNPNREAAYCYCRGDHLSFFSRPVKQARKSKKVESE
jgi:hypothetical protein